MFVARSKGVPVLGVLLVILASPSLNGQAAMGGTAARVATAARTSQPPRIDGTLDDPIWGTAPAVTDFRQKEPLETQRGTEKTEVHILYDARHVYFGIHCYDNHPKDIVATQLRQDLSQDLQDNFAIIIDPTLCHRKGYVFEVNALGTQRDGEVVEEQAPPQSDSIVDPSWDGLWISAAKITNDGWTATVFCNRRMSLGEEPGRWWRKAPFRF